MNTAERLAHLWVLTDPGLKRTSKVIRETFDQTYDGQRTGRYRWDQLHKTEKTHFGTLIEINLRREFDDIINDGTVLDYQIDGMDVDCKYSQSMGGWMIPPEALNHHLLVLTASDDKGTWSMGFVLASDEVLGSGSNRDRKRTISAAGREQIAWVTRDEPLPPNALLHIAPDVIEQIFASQSGQQRINTLFRLVQGVPLSRVVVATVAQQDDYMKRVRDNGGARQHLRPEGILIFGHWKSHAALLKQLGFPPLQHGESMSLRVEPSNADSPNTISLDGTYWKVADADSCWVGDAPALPKR